ncbi:hypothetical protein K435DRAFT_565467, partial [Dendrothele bispora CBS 962.96]
SKRQKNQSDETQGSDERFHQNLQLLVRKFTSTEMMWLRELNRTLEMALDEEYEDHDRFDSLETRLQGQIHTLHEFLPEKYLEILNTQVMKDTFRMHMQMQRSNTVTRIRNQCGPAIFDCSIEDLADPAERKLKFRKAIGWNESEKTYKRWNCSILHGNGSSQLNDTVFCSQPMLRCFAAIFFGTSAVAAIRADKLVGRGKETVAGIWSMTHTTPGAIAMCAVMIRWSLSEDVLLQELGKHTKIDWQNDFESYLKFLLNGIKGRKQAVVMLFRKYDKIFFPGTETGYCVRKNEDDQDEEAMDMLNKDQE